MKDIQLLWVYSSYMHPGFGVKSHSHDYYHLISVICGEMLFTMNGMDYCMRKGDTVLVPTGCIHRFENNTDRPLRYLEVKFTVLNKNLNGTLSSCSSEPRDDAFISKLVENIVNEYEKNCALKDDSASAALMTLIYHITKNVREREGADTGVIDTRGYSPLAKKTIDYLSDHYAENLSLDNISTGVGITKTYLCNAFKKNTGITIVDCLNMIRVRKAAELIVYSDLSLTQVAEQCGYVSPSHFNRIFMRYVGLPPGQCRRAYTYDWLLKEDEVTRQSDSFMYSVLARKSISSELINMIEGKKSPESPDE